MGKTVYTEETKAEILRRMASGESLASICAEEGMPYTSTVFEWCHTSPVFKAKYLAAQEARAECIFEEILAIADTPVEGTRTKENEDGTETVTEDMLGHRRLQIDARKWVLGRMAPKRFGEKVELDHKSSDGTMSPKDMTDDQKAAKIAAILARAEAKRKADKAALDDGSDMV